MSKVSHGQNGFAISMGYSIGNFSYSQSMLDNKFTPIHALDFSIGTDNGAEVSLLFGFSSFLNHSSLMNSKRYTDDGYEMTQRSDKNGLTMLISKVNIPFLENVFLENDKILLGAEVGFFSPTFNYRRGAFNYFETGEEKIFGEILGLNTVYKWKYFKFTGSVGRLGGFYNTEFCCKTTNHLYVHLGIGVFLEKKWN